MTVATSFQTVSVEKFFQLKTKMSASFPWLRFTVTAVGLMGVGYGLMIATVPTEEETYNAMAPDLRRKVDANRAARLAREEAMRQQVTAQSQPQQDQNSAKPIWAESKTSK